LGLAGNKRFSNQLEAFWVKETIELSWARRVLASVPVLQQLVEIKPYEKEDLANEAAT
jgi:hypothetical protein